METDPVPRSRHVAARLAIAAVCAAIFSNAPIAYAYAETVEGVSPHANRSAPVQFGPFRIVVMPDRHDVEATEHRNALRSRMLATRAQMRLRALRAARARADATFRDQHRCPVDHPRLFSNDFGDPRRGENIHLGNDVVAPMGTPVRAPIDGLITQGIDKRGGTIIKLWGNGGHFYIAHLSRYGKSGRVKHGDVIGYVGDSGEARGGPPHAHIEWHPGRAAVNPYRILVGLCYPRTYADVVVGLRLMGLPRR